MRGESGAWADVYRQAPVHWIMYIVNFSVITLACCLPAGFLLKRLDISLKHERKALANLSGEAGKLNEAKQRYQSLFNSKTTFVFVMDDKGNFVDANDLALELFGYSRDELTHINYLQLMHPDQSPDPIARVLEEISDTGIQSEPLEVKLKNKNGETIFLETGGTLIPAKNEIIGVARDITAQKMAESALHESERKYRSVIENIQDVFYRSDDQGRLLMASPSGARMFGFDSVEEMIGIPLDNFWPDPQERQQLLDRIRKDGSVRDFEAVLLRRDGSAFNASFTTQFYCDDQGRLIGTEGFIRDITDKKKADNERQMLEDQLLQAQKMEAIGTLAGGIAHDFNNSLQSILGYTQMLLMDVQEDDPASGRLRQIEAAALRASELTQQILTFSRKIESRLRPVDLNQEVRQVEKLLRRTIPRMIDIDLYLDRSISIVNADAAQIEQVMMNLGVNAMDAMPDGGKMTIETQNEVLDEEYCRRHLEAVPGEYVMLSISDNGIGMDRETLEHLFEPFYTTKEPGKGTGLGLAMVYGIVKNHGGHIMCHSEPGEGTVFRIYFPVVEEGHVSHIRKQEKVAGKGGTETILVVDDEDTIREIAEGMLGKFGYKVIMAANGEEALEIFQKEKDSISLVILDLIMPGIGGKKCLQEILKMDPSQKVVVASGYSVNGSVRDVLETGARGYLKKPYQLEPMLSLVREILDKE
jgi:PAS domain S-box-containing protein